MKIKSNIGKRIDSSKYDRLFLKNHFKKSRNTISNWCSGNSFPSVPELFELADLLECKVDDLYEVLMEGNEMNSVVYSVEDLRNLEKLNFNRNEGLLVNGVSLFDITNINVAIIDNDLIVLRFIGNNDEVASILITDNDKLEIKGENIFNIIN